METLGQYLKKEREFRGILLEDVSRGTKINLRFLQGIEADRWDDLPKGAFVKGFLKGYSSFIGIPIDEVLRRHDSSAPRSDKAENPFQKFRDFEVKNHFFALLFFVIVLIVLAAYLSTR